MRFQNFILKFYRELQENLIRSHAAGVGPALSPDNTRMLLALRINVLSKGHSGISLKTLRQLIDAFNGAYCYCIIPIKNFYIIHQFKQQIDFQYRIFQQAACHGYLSKEQ